MKLIGALVALGLVGCGGDGAPDVAGDWHSPINGFNCERLLSLEDGGSFNLGLVCVLQSNAIALEVHRGTYTAANRTLSLSQTRSSCPGDVRRDLDFAYTITPSNLTLTDPTGAIVFAAVPPGPSSGGAVQKGCFDNSLTFEASPEHDVF